MFTEGDNQVVALSKDHKPNDPLEKARIINGGKKVDFNRVDGRLAVSRAFGDYMFKDEEVSPKAQVVSSVPKIIKAHRYCKRSFILIACDGLFDMKSNEAAGK